MDENATLREAMEAARLAPSVTAASMRGAAGVAAPLSGVTASSTAAVPPFSPASPSAAFPPGGHRGSIAPHSHAPPPHAVAPPLPAPAPAAGFLPSFFAPPPSSLAAPGPTAPGTVSATVAGGDSRAMDLQRLAQSLMEQVAEKDEVLAQQKATKEALAARIRELEAQLAAALAHGR